DAAAIFLDVEDHHFHVVANGDNLGRMDVLVGPIHFGNVYQTFHAFLDFGKAAVVGQVGDLGLDACADRVTLDDDMPWIFAELLEAQGDAHFLAVGLENFNVDFLAVFNDLGRVRDTLPLHVGDVQQAVDTVEVNELNVGGEVLVVTLSIMSFT